MTCSPQQPVKRPASVPKLRCLDARDAKRSIPDPLDEHFTCNFRWLTEIIVKLPHKRIHFPAIFLGMYITSGERCRAKIVVLASMLYLPQDLGKN